MDLSLLTTTFASLISNEARYADEWFVMIAIILMWLKLVSYFRLWDKTRYLIRTILEITRDMAPFLLIFLVMLICYACVLAASFPGK